MSKIYTVYDEDNKIIYTGTSRDELLDKFKIASSNYIYSGEFFLPNKRCKSKIKVTIAKASVIQGNFQKIAPVLLDEARFNSKQLKFLRKKPLETVNLSDMKPVPGYPYHYASKTGHVYVEYEPGKIAKCSEILSSGKTRKYYHVSLYTKDKSKFDAVMSRVIASAWLDNTLNIDYTKDNRDVDHINGEQTLNNSVTNLQILSHAENLKKAMNIYCKGFNGKKCYVYDGKKDRYYPFDSTVEASLWLKAQDDRGIPEGYKPNAGIFSKLYKNKWLRRERYSVGYTKEECKEIYQKNIYDPKKAPEYDCLKFGSNYGI